MLQESFTLLELAAEMHISTTKAYYRYIYTKRAVPVGTKSLTKKKEPVTVTTYKWRSDADRAEVHPGKLALMVEYYKRCTDREKFIQGFHPLVKEDIRRYLDKAIADDSN